MTAYEGPSLAVVLYHAGARTQERLVYTWEDAIFLCSYRIDLVLVFILKGEHLIDNYALTQGGAG